MSAQNPVKAGRRVLFDEGHHNVHGASTTYRAFADVLRDHDFSVSITTTTFNTDVLAQVDVLVIVNARGADGKAPMEQRARPAFSDGEVEAIRSWVEAGHGLFLIADHWPAGEAVRSLAERFGVRMHAGWTEDHDAELRNLAFSRANGLLLEHPVTRGEFPNQRIDKVVTYTGQSLTGPPICASVLRLSDTATDAQPPKSKAEDLRGPPKSGSRV